jgi:hypothetical protein
MHRSIIVLALFCLFLTPGCGAAPDAPEPEQGTEVVPLPTDDAAPAPALTSHPAPFSQASFCEAHPTDAACADGGAK